MSLNESEKTDLFRRLEESGWAWQDDAITAPGETFWLMRDEPWHTDLVDFFERMRGRLSRIKKNVHILTEETITDTESLVTVLEAILCETSEIPSKPWSEIVRFYRELTTLVGPKNEPELRLVEQIAASGYAAGLFPYTSIFTLCMARSHSIRWRREELRIEFHPIRREFHFEYWSHPFVKPGPWKITCGESEGFATLERILLKRLRWFKKQPLHQQGTDRQVNERGDVRSNDDN